MTFRRVSQTLLLSVLLAGASNGAFAVPITFEDPDVPAAAFGTAGSFTTNVGGIDYTVTVTGGSAIVDSATGSVAAGCGIGTTCSDRVVPSGDQHLYIFESGAVSLTLQAGYRMSITDFNAAIASVSPFLLQGTRFVVSGTRSAGFGADPTAATFELGQPGNHTFANELLSDFINLDSVSFAYDSGLAGGFCDTPGNTGSEDGCTLDFALDDLNVTAVSGTTTPTDVPEPASLGLFGLGLIGLRWMRRKQRSA